MFPPMMLPNLIAVYKEFFCWLNCNAVVCSLQLEAVSRLDRLAPTVVDMTLHECSVIESQEPDGLALPRLSLSIVLFTGVPHDAR